jgi:signal transduction histidine kinase
MHDGVGHELLGALHVAREGTVPREAVTEQIQRAMDHLKLTVDVLQEGAQDVATTLGLLRYRLAPRLQACGISMQWQVPELPPLSGWDTRHARDLQLLLYEAFTNLLVHSGATETLFDASLESQSRRLRIRLADNGRGLDPVGDGGNGLASMTARAARLNASISIRNGGVPGFPGACVELWIPLADPAPAPQLSGLREAG